MTGREKRINRDGEQTQRSIETGSSGQLLPTDRVYKGEGRARTASQSTNGRPTTKKEKKTFSPLLLLQQKQLQSLQDGDQRPHGQAVSITKTLSNFLLVLFAR